MDKRIENLISAKKLLNSSLRKSRSFGSSIEKSCSRLDEINHRLLSIELSVGPVQAPKDTLLSVSACVNRSVVPAASVLKVFDAIHGLERSLSDPQSDLPGYLSVLKRLEEALKFLGENCGMAIQWLFDIAKCLEDHKVMDGGFVLRLNRSLESLRELESGEENDCLDGGLLQVALDRLAKEFRRLLSEYSIPLHMPSPASTGHDERASIELSPLPVAVIQKLKAILRRLIANRRLESCISIYIEVRSSNAQDSLQGLDLEYLNMPVSEFNRAPNIDVYISQWSKHLEFVVQHLLEAEYKLCSDVFERAGSNVWKNCFAEIAGQAGILGFLQFGRTVTDSKKDQMKLLKLLDIFASLTKLRSDFNRLFSGDACAEIQNLTRDLIKRVIEGACTSFRELRVQVEQQRHAPPPPDCSIPKAVSSTTDYCNKLLGDDYKPILTQVLVIERSWKREKYRERFLFDDIVILIKVVEQNLEAWSKSYDNAWQTYLFLMNNHWHLYKNLKGTEVGSLLGDSWLTEHEQYKEYYLSMFVRESWGKLPALLSREGLILFTGGRETARDLVKERLRLFNKALDETYRKQSHWVVTDEDLRERIRHVVIQTVVPVYRSYMQSYGALVEQEMDAGKYVKYTVRSLEKMLGALFHPSKPSAGFNTGNVDR
ncbi:exocyst complex component EXO70A1-like [Andrographis paniculata]|uniref:exocyst complex component EXO70A1-like n=1 Tax=Andrographis paniculata TaxID=175694 RepID=UPI0021E791B4|nr:exocyst complex component EXO70A1-like [Andrographis paniculata]